MLAFNWVCYESFPTGYQILASLGTNFTWTINATSACDGLSQEAEDATLYGTITVSNDASARVVNISMPQVVLWWAK